jgi:hypothetical protein
LAWTSPPCGRYTGGAREAPDARGWTALREVLDIRPNLAQMTDGPAQISCRYYVIAGANERIKNDVLHPSTGVRLVYGAPKALITG